MDPINKFYSAFSQGDFNVMKSCYHQDVKFNDPAFGELNYTEVCAMWQMLIERSKGELFVTFSDIKISNQAGSCLWEAKYRFGKKKRKIHNKIIASFILKDNLILKHTDQFSMWKWSRQALGLTGFIIGNTYFFKNKFQRSAKKMLTKYVSEMHES